MKKIVIYIMSLIMILMPIRPVNAMKNDMETLAFSVDGVSISINTFIETYVGKEAGLINAEDAKCTRLQLQVMNAFIESDSIKLNVRIYDPINKETKSSLTISGKIYTGHRSQTEEAESIIVDACTDSVDIQVLLFECVEGISKPNYYAADEKTNKDSFRLFLRQENNILLFEDSLPDIFRNCFQLEYDQITDPMKDLIWYASFVEGELEYIDIEKDEEWIQKRRMLEENSSKAARTLWTGATIYSLTFYVNGDKIQQNSVPFGYYRICNVTSSDATWKAEIYIDESSKKNGTKVNNIDNLVRYKDVSLNFACGKKTEFQNMSMTGRIYNSGGSNVTSAALGVLSVSSKWWSLGTSIYNIFSALISTGSNITLGGAYYSSFSTGTTGIGAKTKSGYSMSKNSYSSSAANNITTAAPAHYLICQAELNSTYTKAESTSTSGAVCIKWFAYKRSDLSTIDSNGKKQAKVSYTASY